MKKIVILALLLFTFSVSIFSQTLREVKKQTLVSDDAPRLRLKFDKKFKFVGSQKIILYNRAEAEQYFFVEAEDKKIKRLYMLQFENFLPDVKGNYNYNEPQTVQIGAMDFFANSEIVPNVEAALKGVPDSDIAKAAAFLKSKGFILMKGLLYQRFVRVVSDDKRREFIMLYVEDTEGGNLEQRKADLQQRALENFKVIK